MKRIMTLLLSLVMILTSSYTALANVNINTTVKILDKNGTRDISVQLSERYVSDDYVLMVPVENVLKEMGFVSFQWNKESNLMGAGRASDQRKIALYYAGSNAGLYAYECKNVDGRKLDTTFVKPTVVNGKPMIAIKDLISLTFDTVRVDPSTSTFYIALDGYATDYIYSLPTPDTWEQNAKAGTIGNKYVAKEDMVALYSSDGRIRYTRPDEVEAYKKVGWYEKCPIVGKTYWFSDYILPYVDFDPSSQYMQQRPKWLQRAITGYNNTSLEKINENQYKITEFYYWENSKLVKVDAEVLLNGYDYNSAWTTYDVVCVENPQIKYGISNWEWSKIQKGEDTFIGMTYNGFKLAGHFKPDRINRTTTAYGTHEQWVYIYTRSMDFYYFENGRLTAWQD